MSGEQVNGEIDVESSEQEEGSWQDLVAKYHESGLSPEEADRFLEESLGGSKLLEKADAILPTAIVAGYVATGTVVDTFESLPSLGRPWEALNYALNRFHGIINFGPATSVKEHIPFLIFETASLWGIAKKAISKRRARKEEEDAAKLQDTIADQIDAGEMKWDMLEGSTVAFVGEGDHLAELLADRNPNSVVQLASSKPSKGVWSRLVENSSGLEVQLALERASIAKAGELLFCPAKKNQAYLPGQDDHDMTIDQFEAYVELVDSTVGYSSKKVVIVGSGSQESTYQSSNDTDEEATEITETLSERVERLNRERDGDVVLIDPTVEVTKKILELAGGRRINFENEKSGDPYRRRFYNALEKAGYVKGDRSEERVQAALLVAVYSDSPIPTEPIRVYYNVTDIPTTVKSGKDDIIVLLDPSQKQVLIDRMYTDEEKQEMVDNGEELGANIIIVSELITDVLETVVSDEPQATA